MSADAKPGDEGSLAPVKVPLRLWAGISAFVLAVGLAGYIATGTPQASGEQGHAAGAEQIETMVLRLEERLRNQPDDAEGWAMLGRSKMVLGRMEESMAAYARVLKLKPDDAGALADYADAMGAANGRSLEGEPARLIERALKLEPDHLKARALAGAREFQRNDLAAAARHWERIVQVAPPDHPFVELARRGLSEVQLRLADGRGAPPAAPGGATAGGPRVAQAPAAAAKPAPPAAAGTAAPPAPAAPAAAAQGIAGTVRLAAALAGKAGPEDRVFIFARPAAGGMPLAILQLRVKDLPAAFKLDDSQAMSPAARLSSAETVVVTARVSKSGQAMPSSGDFEGQSAPVKPGAGGVVVEIANVRP